ncbi:MAG TPA: 5-dehydro-2-deoxygluconokinase [Trueperaceae bacterium]
MTHPAFDLITMGRSSIDLYANDIGAAFEDIESFAAYVGGSPTNIAVAARRLGLQVALLTAVGDDKVGDFILKFLRSEGVDTGFIPRKPGTRSSAVLLGIEAGARFPLVYYRDNAADTHLGISDVLAAPIAASRALEISGTGLSREPGRSATLLAAETAQRSGVTVYLDLDFRADQWHDPRAFGVNVRAILPYVDVLLGTEEEINAAMLQDAAQLRIVGQQVSAPQIQGDTEANIEGILGLPGGPEALVVKRGAQGATVHLRHGEVLRAPGFPVEVTNVLGAGDAFAGGFIYGRLQGWDWQKSARMGNACGAIVVTRHGCANFMGTRSEVLDFIDARGGF